MGKYKELAADIVAHVGGKENVTGLRTLFYTTEVQSGR